MRGEIPQVTDHLSSVCHLYYLSQLFCHAFLYHMYMFLILSLA